MAMPLSRKRDFDTPLIPDRLYFKIGDVARICSVETYVLRFWESQFPQLKPNKSGTGQRLYRRRDVEMALEIKRLVHGEGYTLSGARQALAQHRRPEAQSPLPVAGPDAERRMDKLQPPLARPGPNYAKSLAALSSHPAPRAAARRVATLPAHSGSLFPP